MVIASGHEPGVIGQIASGSTCGTLFSRAILVPTRLSPREGGGQGKDGQGDGTSEPEVEDKPEMGVRAQVSGSGYWSGVKGAYDRSTTAQSIMDAVVAK